jgi:hypothetical protein
MGRSHGFGFTLLVTLAACSSSSSSSAPNDAGSTGSSATGSTSSTAKSSGATKSSSAATGTTKGGSSTTAGSNSTGTATSGGSSAPPGTPWTVASGLADASVFSLTAVGSSLYWVSYSQSGNTPVGIMTVPIAGGTPSLLLAVTNIDRNLATDGTLLYFSATTKPDGGAWSAEIDSVGLDGTGRKVVSSTTANATSPSFSTGVSALFNDEDYASSLFVVAGNLYFAATGVYEDATGMATIWSAPVAGGPATPIITNAYQDSGAIDQMQALVWADSSGLCHRRGHGRDERPRSVRAHSRDTPRRPHHRRDRQREP